MAEDGPVEDYNFYLNARKTSAVRVAWIEYQGRRGLDIREHYLNDDDEWQPTSKGMRIKEDLVPDFIDWLKGELDASVSEPEEQEPEPEPEVRRTAKRRPVPVIGEETEPTPRRRRQ
jgi:hypothetical protein